MHQKIGEFVEFDEHGSLNCEIFRKIEADSLRFEESFF